MERVVALAVERAAAATATAGGDDGRSSRQQGEEEEKKELYETQGLSGRLGAAAMHFGRRDPVLTCTWCAFRCVCVWGGGGS